MRVIISVYDKTGITEFARVLEGHGAELYSTGGTEAHLRNAGVEVHGIQELTGSPELLEGRVKTLHPAVHAGILAVRDNPRHLRELAEHGMKTVDMVVVNLYPFLETVRQSGANVAAALENIDIGGQTLLRAAAKNFTHVLAVSDPDDYPRLIGELARQEGVSGDTRRRLAAKAFQHCAVYDTHVSTYLRPHDELFPAEYTVALSKLADFRGGENPHQLAALYQESSPKPRPHAVVGATQLHGIQPSYNNTRDADLAWQAVSDFASTAVAIFKHGNPVGLSLGDSVADAYRKALATDPQSAFGSAIAANRVVDEEAAREIVAVFFEDLVAPNYTAEALSLLRRKQDLRVLATHADFGTRGVNGASSVPGELDYQRLLGGFLVQTPDALPEQSFHPNVVTRRQPSLAEVTSLYFAWRAVKHGRSSAVVLAKGHALVGIGVGQPNRLDAVDLACRKAGDRAQGAVLASDAFFAFPDGIERAADAGVTAVIQPGGAARDTEVIRVANRHGLAMVVTGERHYRI